MDALPSMLSKGLAAAECRSLVGPILYLSAPTLGASTDKKSPRCRTVGARARPRGTVDANGHLQRAEPFDGVVEGHTLRENVTQGKEEKRLLGRRRRLKENLFILRQITIF